MNRYTDKEDDMLYNTLNNAFNAVAFVLSYLFIQLFMLAPLIIALFTGDMKNLYWLFVSVPVPLIALFLGRRSIWLTRPEDGNL